MPLTFQLLCTTQQDVGLAACFLAIGLSALVAGRAQNQQHKDINLANMIPLVPLMSEEMIGIKSARSAVLGGSILPLLRLSLVLTATATKQLSEPPELAVSFKILAMYHLART